MSKSKVPYEKKVEIVRDYLDGRVGYPTRPSRQSLAILWGLWKNGTFLTESLVLMLWFPPDGLTAV